MRLFAPWKEMALSTVGREGLEEYIGVRGEAGLGFAIPYLDHGQPHDYVPDFLVQLKVQFRVHLILETKSYDPLAQVKVQAAQRWVAAVNADGQYGRWHYAVAYKPEEVRQRLEETVTRLQEEGGPLNWPPSADAVAGNGGPLNWPPSADAVAEGGESWTKPVRTVRNALCQSVPPLRRSMAPDCVSSVPSSFIVPVLVVAA